MLRKINNSKPCDSDDHYLPHGSKLETGSWENICSKCFQKTRFKAANPYGYLSSYIYEVEVVK